jgi:acetylornithine deacetylase/succinyl-diaminopimelate desuccinylase-like protein
LGPGETRASVVRDLQRCVDRALAGWSNPPAVSIGLVQASFATWTGATFSAPEFMPAWWTEEGSPLVQAAIRGLASVAIDPTPTHYSFCSNGSYLAGEAGIPTIGFGVGVEEVAHQVDEHVTLDSLRRGARGYAALAAELAGGRR